MTKMGRPKLDNAKPVSYTHLDVYKRQGEPSGYAETGSCFRKPEISVWGQGHADQKP